ncbi:hypothetical protein SCOR_16120 [Sulfidibacter corallicola]|uniref:Uncharacterized protein n=1 Tax=Sulfidibacter corallicola TaxID=2818388 RepID=A0A8A4TXE8_SULCO|nr:hypothetical protein [Sulfidibacter corallicola]QTD54007.1 hypothetical protein J3U87_16295 [Sulfidibacter corallicola]
MSERALCRNRIERRQWSWTPEGCAEATSCERITAHRLPDGPWLQERHETSVLSERIEPPEFGRQRRLWATWLATRDNPLSFQMTHHRESGHFLARLDTSHTTTTTWTFSISLTCEALGFHVSSFSFAMRQPPTRALMYWLDEWMRPLSAPPESLRSFAAANPTASIHVPALRLLHVLGDALPHLRRLDSPSGRWIETTSHRISPERKGAMAFGGPIYLRFVPQRATIETAATSFRVVAHDPDRKLLILRDGWGSQARMRVLTLDQPLYRHYKSFRFGGPRARLLVDGVDYDMPSARWHLMDIGG